MTPTAPTAPTYHAASSVTNDRTHDAATPTAIRALRFAGWATLTIAAAQAVGLIWAWSMFRFVGIEPDMREIATQGAALPYVFTLIPCAGFVVFAAYALSAAGDLRRLPLLQTGLVTIAAIFLYRATFYEGIAAVRAGDVTQIAFAAISLLIGLCYAYGAAARRRGAGGRRAR